MKMNNITVFPDNGTIFNPNLIKFPGGEIQVRIPYEELRPEDNLNVRTLRIFASIVDSDHIIALSQLADAIRQFYAEIDKIILVMGYIPYARQDRLCNYGESLSAKVFANIINVLNFDSVVVLDPHSDVAPALLNDCHILDFNIVLDYSAHLKTVMKNRTLVAPDIGATKRLTEICKCLEKDEPFIQGLKQRDTKTGELTSFDFIGDVKGKDLLIVDDICDGGGTFIGLTNKLLAAGANSVSLYVTHGIFSKGVNHLLNNGIKEVFTTDSLPQSATKKLNVIEFFEGVM